MSEVDLNDLKIDHKPRRRSPWIPFLPLFLISFLLGGLLTYLLFPREPRYSPEQGRKNDPIDPSPGPSGPAPVFTEGGWIEVPSYHPIVVSALIPGRVDELRVLEGSAVKKGDVIAMLYQKDLKDGMEKAAAELKVAEATLLRLRAGFRMQEVEAARADFAAAQADLKLKKQILERTRKVVSSGAVSEEDLDRDEAEYAGAKARYEKLRQELQLKEEGSRVEDIQAAEAEVRRRRALLELARNQLEYGTIRSPADGVVLERYVTPGTSISMANPRIVSLYDPGDLQVRVDVRQENIGRVFVGQRVEVFTDAEPERSYPGTVIRLEPKADFKKNTVQVKVKLQETSRLLHPEMIARIQFAPPGEDGDHP